MWVRLQSCCAKQPQFQLPKGARRCDGVIIKAEHGFGPPQWKRERAERRSAATLRGEGQDIWKKLAEWKKARGEY
jgi:hypothetical protein